MALEPAIHPDTLPWGFDPTVTDEEGMPAIVDQDRVVVAFLSDDGLPEDGSDEIMEERGRLMAAAPELFAALRVARRYVADLPIVGDEDLAIVDAALAKATWGPDPANG